MGFIQKIKKIGKEKVVPAVRNFGQAVISWAPIIVTASTAAAAWVGYNKSIDNERHVRELEADRDRMAEVINHNADILQDHLDEAKKLEETNKELLDEALGITEGAEPEEAEKSA